MAIPQADKLLLSSSKFRTISSDDQSSVHLEEAPYIRFASAEFLDEVPRKISVLIEVNTCNDQETYSEPNSNISQLAQHLATRPPNRGILKCLGYREGLELVFEIPEQFERPKSLRDMICSTADDVHGGGHALDHRFRLAYDISDAILAVHSCRLVHKNIRTETILLFQRKSVDSPTGVPIDTGIGVPFLINWSMLRKETHASSRVGEDDWMKDIYRHPQRQGMHPQERYNMGHDIYSLGVCLLEIGLWAPLIVMEEGSHRPCAIYRQMAVRSGGITVEESNSVKALTRPGIIQPTLVLLASMELPKRMGIEFFKIVVACLTCLEGGFGQLEGDETQFGVRYIDIVLRTLAKLNTSLGPDSDIG